MADKEEGSKIGGSEIVQNEQRKPGYFENPARSADMEIPMEQVVNDVEFIDTKFHTRHLERQRIKNRFFSDVEKLLKKYSGVLGIHYGLRGHIPTISVDKGHEINIERSYTKLRQGELVIGMTDPFALMYLLRDSSTTREEAFWKLIKMLGLRIPSDEILRITAKNNLGIGTAEAVSLDAILAQQEKLKEKLGEDKFNDIEPAYREVIKELLPKYDRQKINDIVKDMIVLAAIDFEEKINPEKEKTRLKRGFYEYRIGGDNFFYADKFIEKKMESFGAKKENKAVTWMKGFWKRYGAPYQYNHYFTLNGRKKEIKPFARFYRWARAEKILDLLNKDRIGYSELERSLKVINDFAESAKEKGKYPILLMPDPFESVAAALFVNECAYKEDSEKYVHLVPRLSKDPDENRMKQGSDEKGFFK